MCAQIDVLKKIRKEGKVNGHDVDLAEAQAKDYMAMKHRLDNIESDVCSIKTEQTRQGEIQAEQGRMIAEQGGMIKAIFNRLNSPVEQERLDGQKWNLITSIAKHKAAWVILALVLVAFALAGDRMASLVGDIIRKMIGE